MKKIMLIFSFTHLLLYSFAQQSCKDEVIMNTKGSWKKTSDANMKAGNQAQVTSRIDKMQKLLQAAYAEPKGIEAKWYRSMINNPLLTNGPIPYQLNSLFLAYFCNTNNDNKIEAGEETGTWFYVWANHFNWFAEYIKYYIIQKQPVYLLTPQVGEINGYPLYKGIHNENSNTGIKYSRAIIITRDGQMPYISVTKKQFLKAFLNNNEKRFVKTLDFEKNRAVKTDEQEEAEKKKNLELLERVTRADKLARAKENFLRNYITDKQRKENTIAKLQKMHDDDMNPARNLLADSLKSELAEPAILDFNNLLEFEEFSTLEKGGRELVRLNPEYFDSKLPKYVPQFLIVYWRWDKNKPAENFKDQLEANFNFTTLKEMIDK